MGRTAARKKQLGKGETPREAVSADTYEGIDFDAFNAKVTEFRRATESEGFSASFSKFTEVPTAVVQHDARTL